jgi:hypothetical protein
MIRILLLDCSAGLERKLKSQGFDVESGTLGYCTGIRELPSQVYEKDVFIYNPSAIAEMTLENVGVLIAPMRIEDLTPQYSFNYLQTRIEAGATFLVFVNRLSDNIAVQQAAYKWIPFMPSIEFTSDQSVGVNEFNEYPDSKEKLLSPIVNPEELDFPIRQKLRLPENQDRRPRDVYYLFSNENHDPLGVVIPRGRGRLIVLPKFLSNDEAIETFLHRVVPAIYETSARTGLVEMFNSPSEQSNEHELERLRLAGQEIKKRENDVRVQLTTATREKANIIQADDTAKQIMTYYSQARRQPDAALFYLYKIIEAIENKFGGEAVGIAKVGAGAQWKSVKRLTNESYRDARHAPKPTDIIKQWSKAEIEKCFEDTEKVVMAYFATLFPPNTGSQ